MGYVAVSNDKETKRIGRRDIMVTWRGTVTPTEWYQDLQQNLVPIGHGEAKVEQGFLSIYKSKSEKTRYNKSSASEQVMKEIKRQVQFYETLHEEVSVTITGHSLGGALALLNAYEVASAFPKVHVSVISFGAPRVGNSDFRDEMCRKNVKVLRIVSKQDFVPQMPGLIFNEGLEKFESITGELDWLYTHVGTELTVDLESSPFLKHDFNVIGFHSLETYLHLVDGYISSVSTFRIKARRDVALVNKGCDMLLDELKVPPCWNQMANKGLERNKIGRWIQPKREPEDIPSPIRHISSNHVFEGPEDHLGLLALLDSQ
jgi:hypothetical protein